MPLMGLLDFPDGSAGEEFACNAKDTGKVSLIPGLGGSPGKENGTRSSILAWKMDRGA